MKKDIINFEKIKIASIFAVSIAKVAQLVEHDLAKVGVAGSSPVFRSTRKNSTKQASFVIFFSLTLPKW